VSAVRNMEAVVEALLCTGCGACAGICPEGAVTMAETPGGLLWPRVDNGRCTHCGLCTAICPGTHLEKGLLPAEADPFEGAVVAAYRGQATDQHVLWSGASGGVATAILLAALDAELIQAAVVTGWRPDAPTRPLTLVTSDSEVVKAAQGSRYCPTPAMAEVMRALKPGTSLAFSGLPCHVHALRNAQRRVAALRDVTVYAVGLICEGVLSYHAAHYLVSRSGVDRSAVSHFAYRSKRWRGWPGDTLVCDAHGTEHWLPREVRMGCKEAFRPPRCRLCFDKMNVLADVTLGDGYNLVTDEAGVSAVLVRTAQGARLIKCATRAQAVQLEPVSPQSILQGQGIPRKRQEWAAYCQVWAEMGHQLPEHGVGERWHSTAPRASLRQARRHMEWSLLMAQCDSAKEFARGARRRLARSRLAGALSPSHCSETARRLLGRAYRAACALSGSGRAEKTTAAQPDHHGAGDDAAHAGGAGPSKWTGGQP